MVTMKNVPLNILKYRYYCTKCLNYLIKYASICEYVVKGAGEERDTFVIWCKVF